MYSHIVWTEEQDRLQSMKLQRVRHNCATNFHFFTFIIFKSLVAQMAMQETLVKSLGQEDPLEEEMATHFLPGKSHEQGGA